MTSVSIELAWQVVPKPNGRQVIKNNSGITSDIITAIQEIFNSSYHQTEKLAKLLIGKTDLETLHNVFLFTRKNIRYVLDPENKQLIREPADIIHNQVADCKGLTILINSLLTNLGIRSAFRFVSFSPLPTPTHVYAVAYVAGKEYILDACLPGFNQEKPYTYKKDYMTQIVHVSGINHQRFRARKKLQGYSRTAVRRMAPGDTFRETPLNISGYETAAEMDLKLHRQGLEIERNIAASVAGISSPAVANLTEGINAYSAAIAALKNNDPGRIAAIGSAIGKKKKKGGFLKKVTSAVKKTVKKVTAAPKKVIKKVTAAPKSIIKKAASTVKTATRAVRQSKLIKKVAKTVANTAKKAVKFAAKVVTAPQRLFIKALGEVFIPKMAPFFLYLFVTNQQTISALPQTVQRKRKKAEPFAKFMTNVVGMKEAHFMKLVRNGIMKQYKKTPEQLLATRVKGSINGISGIGYAQLLALLPVIMEVIGKITSLFGKKPAPDEMPTEEDIPDLESDFVEMAESESRQLLTHLTYKPASQRGEEPGDYADEARELRAEESVLQQVYSEPADTPVTAPLPMPEPEPGEEPEPEYESEPMANGRQAAPGGSGSSSSSILPLAAGGVALAWALSKGK